MKKYFISFTKHPLIVGSGVIFFGSIFVNIINFLFNLFMIRNLSVVDYGILASILSFMSLVAMPAGAISPTILRFASSYLAQSEYGKMRGLFFKVLKLCTVLGLTILISSFLLKTQISSFFRIDDVFLIVISGLIVFIGFLSTITMTILQAKLLFKYITFINFTGSLLKLSCGVILVYLGFSVKGAAFGFFFSSLATYFLSFFPLGFLFKKDVKQIAVSNKELLMYGAPSALSFFGITSFITTDIILVKHFFDPQSAGMYAGISLIARAIFFLTAPFVTVMFPMIVRKHARNEKYHSTFWLALLLVVVPSIVLSGIYFEFPFFVITLFSKKEYSALSSLLGLFAVFITAYSALFLFTNFFLSIKKVKIWIPILLCSLSQAVLIWFFHASFLQVVEISLFVESLLLIFFLLYYMKLYDAKR